MLMISCMTGYDITQITSIINLVSIILRNSEIHLFVRKKLYFFEKVLYEMIAKNHILFRNKSLKNEKTFFLYNL